MTRLTAAQLEEIERECRAEPECRWSVVKLAMIEEIRAARLAARRGYDLVWHLERQRRFSEQAFGPGYRWRGVIDHIRRELLEIEADPTDLSEWIDVAMLAFDGAWRSGASPQEIATEFLAKLVKNEWREWPDWRKADPDKAIEHVRPAAGGAS